MTVEDTTTVVQLNTFGAIVFFSYIVAALLLTGIIISDLYPRYKTHLQTRNGQSSFRLRTTIFLALLSFASLSYHMLHFLTVSYFKWSASLDIYWEMDTTLYLDVGDEVYSLPDVHGVDT